MSPSRIRVLSDQTINKIAAGEVIENPSSVVKELVENSLDAGAAQICVEIQGGGRQLIRVSDNGCGMLRDDALLCLERHATSKIREVEDIQDLLTMGFRGEAIPSIAAISKFTLLTCPRVEEKESAANEGTLVLVDGGRLISCASAARSPGTTIEVKSLFFNVPVRRQFQKSPASDIQDIVKMLGILALGYPTVQFELISDQKSLLKTTSSTQLLSFHELLGKRLECILGKEYASTLLPLKFQQAPYELEGFIGSPTSHKPNRTGQHLFINQRAISSSLIAAAIREGYGTMLPTQRYPIFVIHLRMPGSLLDINVHPQKKEVRLRQEQHLKEIIIQAIQMSLRQRQGHMESVSSHPEKPIPIPVEEKPIPAPIWEPYASLLSPFSHARASSEDKWEFKTAVPMSSPPPPSTQASPSLFSKSEKQQQVVPRVLATLLGYMIVDPFHLDMRLLGGGLTRGEGGLALVDQRAAYSRIHYEQLLKRSESQEIQPLLIPLTVQLSAHEANIVREFLPLFDRMGFGLREFGNDTFVMDHFPLFLKQNQLQTCLSLLIQDLIEMQTTRRLQVQREEQLALAACRASIPTTQRLSLEEAQGLIQRLVVCDLPAQCPLGKPTCLYIAPEDIAKWFQKKDFS